MHELHTVCEVARGLHLRVRAGWAVVKATIRRGALLVLASATLAACQMPWSSNTPTAAPVPSPDLSKLVPANYTVTKTLRLKISGAAEPEIVVASVGPGLTEHQPADLQILRWDGIAKRWNSVFDASQTTAPPNFSQGAPLVSPIPLLPGDAHDAITDVIGATLHDGPGVQLVFNFNYAYNDPVGEFGVIDYKDGRFQLAYWREAAGGMGITVEGVAPRQKVRIVQKWVTLVDANCCPVRNMTTEVGGMPQGIGVLSDDRPWIGADLVSLHSTDAHVLKVYSGSAADGKLQFGDVITDIAGEINPPTNLGPGVVDAVAKHHPGDRVALDVTRGGKQVQVALTLGSMADPSAAGHIDEFTSVQRAYFGVSASNAGAGLPPGVLVAQTVSGGPAESAGLVPGDEIVAIGNDAITSLDDITMTSLHYPAGTATTIGFLDPQGQRHNSQITPTPGQTGPGTGVNEYPV